MEATIHKELRAGQLRRQIKLAPEAPVAASEDGFGARLIAVQLAGQFHYPLQITPQTYIFAIFLGVANRVTHQVLQQNGFFTMRFVLRRPWLKIETDRAASFILNALQLCQLTDVFARNHYHFLLSIKSRFNLCLFFAICPWIEWQATENDADVHE